MKVKKVAALLMATVMAMSLMAGCGSNDGRDSGSQSNESKTQESESKAEESKTKEAAGGPITFPLAETIEFTAFSGMNQSYSLQDNLAMQEAMSRANINITFDSVLAADQGEKMNLILASGEYPDMLFKSGIRIGDLTKYGGQGILIPLEDLIHEYMPNLTAKLDELDGWQYLTSPDGHIYSVPQISNRGEINLFWLNKRWLDNLGLHEPKSMDELYQVLKAFKEQDANGNGDVNDEIPYSLTQGDYLGLLKYSEFCYDESTMCAVIDGRLTYVPTTDYFKEYVAFLAKLYQEGLLEQNSFTQGGEQQQAIGQSGDVYGSFWTMGAFLTVGRDNDDDYVVMTPFYEDTYPILTGITDGTVAITDACENPEVLMAWLDYFYSEEGGILAWMGVEGKTYQVADNGKWEWILGGEYGDDIATVRSSSAIQGAQAHPSIQPAFWFEMSPEVDADEVYLNNERKRIAELGKVALPVMAYTEEDNAQIATFRADIDSYINQFIAQVCIGEVNLESGWDTYLETMEAMGASRLAELHEKTYNASVQ